jgi:hypothetical protein
VLYGNSNANKEPTLYHSFDIIVEEVTLEEEEMQFE